MFTPPDDIQMPAVNPQQIASFLAQKPRKLKLTSTSDGLWYEFNNDGGKVGASLDRGSGHTVYSVTHNGRAQDAVNAARRVRTDKGFEGVNAFVAAEPIKPAFPGDTLHTGPGGCIVLMTDQHRKAIEDSKTVAEKRRRAIQAEAQVAAAQYQKLVNPGAQQAEAGEKTVSALIADAEAKRDAHHAEREAELKAEIEALKAAATPAPKDETPEPPEAPKRRRRSSNQGAEEG